MTVEQIKPPFTYFGGKTRIAAQIAALLPAHEHYVEPFAGSLAVLLAKRPARAETVNDLSGDLCVGPGTRILTADLRWVNAGDVSIGDRLLGFDENNGPASPGLRAPSRYRHWRLTEVVAVKRVVKPAYRLTFDDGTTVVASEDHMWLGGSHASGSRGWRWQSTKGLVCNRRNQRSWILKLADVAETEDSREAGWLAGFFDGEGNIGSYGTLKSGWRISAAQKLGPEADACERLLKERGFATSVHVRSRGNPAWQPVAEITLGGGMSEALRFLMLVRPERLVRNFITNCVENASLYGRSHQAVGLVDKEFIGDQEVVAIETTSHTYVAEGLASHNCNFWRVLREQPDDLERVCALTPHSREEHQLCYEPAEGDLERARRTWVRLTQGRAGQIRQRTGWRFREKPETHSMPAYLASYVSRLHPAARRLASVSIECRPAVDVVAAYGRHEGVLIYADPPYLDSTRTNALHGDVYVHEMRGEDSHRELAAALRAARATVVLSGYDSPLYAELFEGWHRTDLTATCGNSPDALSRTEVLWSNRPFPQASLFDGLETA